MPNPTVARDLARRKKIEAMRAEQRASRRRRYAAFGSAITVVLVVLALVLVKVSTGGSTKAPAAATTTASGTVVSKVASVPQDGSRRRRQGQRRHSTVRLLGRGPDVCRQARDRLRRRGVLPVLRCERWAVVQALSRFGTFTGLGETTSSSTDVYPSTATLSFHGATYASQYLSFRGFEETTNQPNGMRRVHGARHRARGTSRSW